MNNLQTWNHTLSVSSLGAYMSWANQIPMLSLEEEQALAYSFKNNNDLEAAQKLVLSHLRFVIRIARGYSGYGLPQCDLIQEGNIGLMKAVKRFDPSVGVRLVSFAVHWVKAEIHEFVIRHWRIVKVATTKAQRKLFFNLRKLSQKNRLSEKDADMISETLNVSKANVREMEKRLLNHYDESFDGHDDSDEDWQAPCNYLEDHSTDPANVLEKEDWDQQYEARLEQAVDQLDARSKDIVIQRWLSEKKTPLRTLADKYNISMERVRQLEQQAFGALRQAISD